MPPKKCSNKVPANQREDPHTCLKKGVGIGKNLQVPVTMGLSKDVLRHLARINNVKNYSKMSKRELYDNLISKGVKKFKPFELV